uniref:Activin types I and II receptor domain-containing protein n=1 Tax=Callithrix jacchus TaxID=9483 RepID=A0A2R8N617_CALJA|nr:uncharacterized protein LOC103792359 [Callithrix jacchus]
MKALRGKDRENKDGEKLRESQSSLRHGEGGRRVGRKATDTTQEQERKLSYRDNMQREQRRPSRQGQTPFPGQAGALLPAESGWRIWSRFCTPNSLPRCVCLRVPPCLAQMLQLYKSRDLRVQITSPRFLSLGLAMGTSSIFLCILFLCGTLGLTMSPARGRLRCYTCGFAKPCYPVPTECQDDEACSISIGTSDQSEIIQRKGCLPRAQCPLLGHATYWLRSYTLRHHCCEQDLCNRVASPRQLPSLLTSLPLLVASFAGRGHLLY